MPVTVDLEEDIEARLHLVCRDSSKLVIKIIHEVETKNVTIRRKRQLNVEFDSENKLETTYIYLIKVQESTNQNGERMVFLVS